jgi:arabinogalactan endo-1,4-beta-galactosidase
LLDIHYSDSWADPGQQKKPAAWADLPFAQLERQVHDYSCDVLVHLRKNGAMPNIVQVGNEIKNGLLFGNGLHNSGPRPGGGFRENDKGGTLRAVQLLAAGAKGAREGSLPAPTKIMLHIPDGQDTGFVKWFFSQLETTARGATSAIALDYDIIGLSYYPADPWDRKAGYNAWHLSHLVDSMNHLATTYKKPIMVVETNWPRTGEVQKIPGVPEFPILLEGQAAILCGSSFCYPRCAARSRCGRFGVGADRHVELEFPIR